MGRGYRQTHRNLEKESDMKPEELDVVELLRPLPEHGLPAGSRGTIVMNHKQFSRKDGVDGINIGRWSAAAKPKLPLLHERLRRLPVVFCQTRMDVVCDLEVHAFLEVAVDRPVEVFFHIAEGN